jgi:hypothetical protein
MPIRPFLAGQAFEPEVIREMSLALETVCAKLALTLTDEPATRLVASKIIELAQRGVPANIAKLPELLSRPSKPQ